MRLTVDSINPNVRRAEYAVRGELAVKSEEFRARLAKGDAGLPFDRVVSANIGNPQQLDQKPITFFRQVCSLLENPQLLDHEDVLVSRLGYKTDVVERAKWLLKHVGSVGAYSASNGVPAIKESIAAFLESELGLTFRWPREARTACRLPASSLLQDAMASLLTPPTSTSRPVPRLASIPSSTSSAPTSPRVF